MSDAGSVVTVVIIGGMAVYRGLRPFLERRSARKAVRAMPVLTSATAEGSVVRVTGIVRAIETLEAPLSGRACVVYRSRAHSRSVIQSTAEVLQLVPFVIDRGADGLVLVEGTTALLDLRPVLTETPERLRAELFLRRHGAELPNMFVSKTSYDEVVVEPGQRVSVAGLMMLDPGVAPDDGERGYRESARPRMRITGNDEHPLAIGQARD